MASKIKYVEIRYCDHCTMPNCKHRNGVVPFVIPELCPLPDAKEHSVALDAEGQCKKCDWWNDKGFETCHNCGNKFPHR